MTDYDDMDGPELAAAVAEKVMGWRGYYDEGVYEEGFVAGPAGVWFCTNKHNLPYGRPSTREFRPDRKLTITAFHALDLHYADLGAKLTLTRGFCSGRLKARYVRAIS